MNAPAAPFAPDRYGPDAMILQGIDGLAWVHLSSADVVRHKIVADIVAAYERHDENQKR